LDGVIANRINQSESNRGGFALISGSMKLESWK
jgi:hypothetical protein